MKYLIKGKIIVLLSIILLTNSCIGMYCILSDDGGSFCSEVRRKSNKREEKRREKRKEREHRKKMEEINKKQGVRKK